MKQKMVDYDFYRCQKCNGLVTKPQMNRGLQTGKPCPCGALKFSPTNARWYEYFFVSVIIFAIQRLRGLV